MMNDDLTTPTTIATGHQPLTTDHDWGPSIMIIYRMYVWETTSHATRTTCTTHRPTPLPILKHHTTHVKTSSHYSTRIPSISSTHPLTPIHPLPNPPPHLLSIRMMMLGDGA